MPTMSSSFSPTTGIRENPLRSASDSAWRRVLPRSTNTMSVRGTITSRTIVSPSSNTEWIIARSSGWITRRCSSRSTSPRRSSSDPGARAPARPRAPGGEQQPGSGPSSRTTGASTDAAALATRTALRRPRDRGTIAGHQVEHDGHDHAAITNARQPCPSQCTSTTVTRTVADSSAATRASSSTAR